MKYFLKSVVFLSVISIFINCSNIDDDDPDPGFIINESLPSFCQTGRNDPLFTCFRIGVFDIKSSITQNSFFPGTETIEIPPYSYPAPPDPTSTLGNIIQVSGDQGLQPLLTSNRCCDISEILDRLPSNPNFQWNTPSSDLVAAAIFKSPIRITSDGNNIENVEDIIWTWNSGMGGEVQSGGKTIVEFAAGKDVQEGQILETTTNLEKFETYVWAVWAWNEDGIIVSSSSRAIPFVVERLPIIALTQPEQLAFSNGTWNIVSAINSNTNLDDTENFPIQSFNLDLNCDEETRQENPMFSTFPENLAGTIDTVQNKIILGSIEFSNISFPCDERVSAIANFDNESFSIIYEIQ